MDKSNIVKVWLDESYTECIHCGMCESMVPEVFEVPLKMIIVETPDLTMVEEIEEAAAECPVATIAINYTGEKSNKESSSEEGFKREDEYQE